MDTKKTVHSLLMRGTALLGILVALTLLINVSWFDERLHPDLERLVQTQPVSTDDNAYPLIYSFRAAPDRDAREAGIEIVRLLEERAERGQSVTLSQPELSDLLGNPDADDFANDFFPSVACNSRFEIDCADRLIADVEQIGVDHPGLAVLLNRYETILGTTRFEESTRLQVDSPIPFTGSLMPVARIRLALSYNGSTTAQFLRDIGEDIAFWKRMLRDGESLVAKMVALAGLRNDTTFLSTLMRERKLSDGELQQLTAVLTRLTPEERNIGETFLAEARMMLLSEKPFAVLVDGPPTIARMALQENATLNEYYLTTTTPLRVRAAMSADEFYSGRAHERLGYELRAVPPPLYNLGGKFVLKWLAAEIGWTDYLSRVHDLDGRIALVLLQAEIERAPERTIEAIAASSNQRNPYTLEPMAYDSRTGQLGFTCLANNSDVCAIQL